MKKKQLNNLTLNKKVVSNFIAGNLLGGSTLSDTAPGHTRDAGCNSKVTITGDPYKECE